MIKPHFGVVDVDISWDIALFVGHDRKFLAGRLAGPEPGEHRQQRQVPLAQMFKRVRAVRPCRLGRQTAIYQQGAKVPLAFLHARQGHLPEMLAIPRPARQLPATENAHRVTIFTDDAQALVARVEDQRLIQEIIAGVNDDAMRPRRRLPRSVTRGRQRGKGLVSAPGVSVVTRTGNMKFSSQHHQGQRQRADTEQSNLHQGNSPSLIVSGRVALACTAADPAGNRRAARRVGFQF